MVHGEPNRAQIGIPWRTSQEEAEQNRPGIQAYEDAVRLAGARPVLLPLGDPVGLRGRLEELEGFLLPGSPADVGPAGYGAENRGLSHPADLPREQTDRAILEHAFQEKKPVLAICYGCQLLNVYLGGTLIQDLRTETGTEVAHRKKDVSPTATKDPEHGVRFAAGSLLEHLAGRPEAVVNSSHHQSVERPGRNLRIAGVSTDGIVEALEWTGDANWVVAVQWHPERMKGDRLAEKLFAELVQAAEKRMKSAAKP